MWTKWLDGKSSSGDLRAHWDAFLQLNRRCSCGGTEVGSQNLIGILRKKSLKAVQCEQMPDEASSRIELSGKVRRRLQAAIWLSHQ
jgi:hypothetical protein